MTTFPAVQTLPPCPPLLHSIQLMDMFSQVLPPSTPSFLQAAQVFHPISRLILLPLTPILRFLGWETGFGSDGSRMRTSEKERVKYESDDHHKFCPTPSIGVSLRSDYVVAEQFKRHPAGVETHLADLLVLGNLFSEQATSCLAPTPFESSASHFRLPSPNNSSISLPVPFQYESSNDTSSFPVLTTTDLWFEDSYFSPYPLLSLNPLLQPLGRVVSPQSRIGRLDIMHYGQVRMVVSVVSTAAAIADKLPEVHQRWEVLGSQILWQQTVCNQSSIRSSPCKPSYLPDLILLSLSCL